MRRFLLRRSEDVSGTSGVGDVAEGCQFHTGECVLVWFGRLHATNRYDNIEALIEIHGHEGRTIVVWLDEVQETDASA